MKKNYECPTIEIVSLEAQDIIIMSQIVDTNGNTIAFEDYNNVK